MPLQNELTADEMTEKDQTQRDLEDQKDQENQNKLIQEHRSKGDLERLRTIEEALGELQEGWQLSIWRKKPKWAAGHLDTEDIIFGDNGRPLIDLEEIKETYGGHQLVLKFLNERGKYQFGKHVTFASRPPKEDGIVLKSPAEKEREEQMKLEQMRMLANQQTGDNGMMKLMLEMMAANRSQDNNSSSATNGTELMKIMLQQTQDMQSERMKMLMASMNKTNPDPMQQMQSMLGMMEMFKKATGADLPKEENTNDMMGMVSGLFDVLKNANTAAQPPQFPQMTPTQARPPQIPSHPQRPPLAVPPRPPAARMPQQPVDHHQPGNDVTPLFQRENEKPIAPPPESVENQEIGMAESPDLDELQEDDIIDTLTDKSPAELASIVASVLGTMDDKKQEQVFEAFNRIGEGGEPEQ